MCPRNDCWLGSDRCNYSIIDPESDNGAKLYCLRRFRHNGPCLGRTDDGHAYTWCGRVCEGCVMHDDSDQALVVRVFTGDVEVVLAEAVAIGCLLPK